jgi:hypothetical protein
MEHYKTSDIKLQAFLRLMSPKSFVGVNKENPQKVSFVFQKSTEISELAMNYLNGTKYEISPKELANLIDEGKSMIFGDFEM